MKKFFVFFSLALLLSLSLFVPVTSATISWNTTLVDSAVDGSSVPINDNGCVAVFDSRYNSFQTSRTAASNYELDRYTPVESTFDTTGTATGREPNCASHIDGEVGGLCYRDDDNENLMFSSTSDGGLSWSSPKAIVLTGNVGFGCTVLFFDESVWAVTYHDATNAEQRSVRTTNAGGTWSTATPAVVDAACDANGDGSTSGSARARDELNGVSIHLCTTPAEYRVCQTIDAGVTWQNCSQMSSNVASQGSFSQLYVYETTYLTAQTSGGTGIVYKSTNDGLSWSQITSFSPTTINTVLSSGMVLPTDVDSWTYVICGSALVAADGNSIAAYSQTEDGGVTWSAEASVTSYLTGTRTSGTDDCTADISGGDIVVIMRATDGNEVLWELEGLDVGAVVGATASVAVTDLTSFDVDKDATVVSARTNSGDFVRTYEALSTDATLDTLGDTDTNCLINDGIFSTPEAVVFIWCDGTNAVSEVRIRAFDTSSQPDFGCDTDDECETTIDLDGDNTCIPADGFQDDNELRQIDHFSSIDIDYSTIAEENTGDDNRAVAWAYASSTHYVGVQQYTTQALCDYYGTDREIYGVQEPDDICSWSTSPDDSGGTLDGTYIGAVGFNVVTKFYKYTPAFPNGVLDGDLSEGEPYSAYGQGVAIDCAGDYAIIGRGAGLDNNIVLLNVATGEEVCTKTVSSVGNDNVAISDNTEFMAYYNGDKIEFAYTDPGNDCEVIGFLLAPTGSSVKGVHLDFGANNAWAASEDFIYWYNLLDEFPDDIEPGCTGFNCEPGVSPTPTAPSGDGGATEEDINNFLESQVFLAIVVIIIATSFGVFIGVKMDSGVATLGFGSVFFILAALGTWKLGWIPDEVIGVGTILMALIGFFIIKK